MTRPYGYLREHPWMLLEFMRTYAWHLYARHRHHDFLIVHDTRPEGNDVY